MTFGNSDNKANSKQIKPNLSQSKACPERSRMGQFAEKGKIDAKCSYTRAYEENAAIAKKIKPIQTQFKPNCRKDKNERFCVDKAPYDCFL